MALLLVSLCYPIRCYHKEPYDPPMSTWMRRIVLDSLSYILGIRHRNVSLIKKETVCDNIIMDNDTEGNVKGNDDL